MRLVSYRSDAGSAAGVLVDDTLIIDAATPAAAAGIALRDGHGISPARQLVAAGVEGLGRLADAAVAAREAGDPRLRTIALDEVELLAPVPDAEKIVCVGLNYLDHASETRLEAPEAPTLFAKFRNSLTGHGAAIVLPPMSREVDYEGELAVVIGRRAKNVTEEHALTAIVGYTILNDVSARDLQMATSQWTAGKAIDGFAPCGPALVSADEIADPQRLTLETRLNGRRVQSAGTDQMIFTVAQLVSYVSALMTLEPGDIIATGTPAGVGFASDPPVFLADGDTVEIEISGIGVLRNTAVIDPGDRS